MADPIIDSVEPPSSPASPIDLSPGQFRDFVIVAHDPDSAEGSASVPVSDSQGGTTDVTVFLRRNDPLTFGDATVEGLSGVTATKIASSPNSATYRVQA